MQLSHYLTQQSIIVPLQATSKEAAISELVDELAKFTGIPNKEKLLAAIDDREKSASTFLPMGVAVPHARVEGVKDISMVVGVCKNAIKDTYGDTPLSANVFCLFLSPTQEKEFGNHLKLLARIAAIFSNPDFVHEIAEIDSPSEVFTRIQKRERQLENA